MTEILRAIAGELEGYSSLGVTYDDIYVYVTRVGSRPYMRLVVYGDHLLCSKFVKAEHGRPLRDERGGSGATLELSDPALMDNLLAVLKRDLR